MQRTNNSGFGYRSPYGNQAPARRQVKPQQNQQSDEYEDDPAFQTQAYLKIGFHTNKGIKFLKFGKTDKQLREASPLERMILEYWRAGHDVNELLSRMHLEVHDAQEDLGDMQFAPNPLFQEEEHFEEPPKPKARKPRAAQPAEDQE